MPDFKNQSVELSSIYEYPFENGLKCKIWAASSNFKTNTAIEYMPLESDAKHEN